MQLNQYSSIVDIEETGISAAVFDMLELFLIFWWFYDLKGILNIKNIMLVKKGLN